MIQTFRSLFNSKIGLAITFGFIALIALAFASGDISGTGSFGGIAGGDRVAVVGGEKIGNAEFSRSVSSAIDQVREEDPTITMPEFIAQEGLDAVLDQLINRYALAVYARKYGLRAGTNLVNSEILTIPAFRGPDGNFSQDVYQAAIGQQGLTDAMVRRGFSESLLADQLMRPASTGTFLPQKIASQYTALLKERRQGAIAFIPSPMFAPERDPSEKELAAFYADNRDNYIRPERRVIRYASFGIESLDTSINPTPAEINARFQRDKAQYAAQETRRLTQLILPTQDAANALRTRAQAGASLVSLAREAGFSTSAIGPVSRTEYAAQTSADVAAAAFAAGSGAIAAPARSALGWHLVRIDGIERTPARSLEQVSAQIGEQLLVEKRAAALADLSARVEEQLDDGTSLAEMAKELGVEVNSSPALTADGRIYGQPGLSAAPQIMGTVETAFQMEEGEPQLAEIVPGTNFMIFEVSDITPAAAAPLSQVKPQVTLAWRLAEGSKLARKAVDRLVKRLAAGDSLDKALAAEKQPLPPADRVNLSRQELVAQAQQVPAPLALFFSMAQGSSKWLAAASDLGWYLVNLETITADPVAADDPLIAATQAQLQSVLVSEYQDQMVAAMRKELGVERNDDAIEAVRKQLVGAS
ncbi:MAG: peptidylprolyl isomerase [Erythrobacter sp. RIFCSPHIGHO2_12_FULL_63_10]|nr:MAG: peptidylprolyl isomerase [Erythrobacter sp. RIFCSPHIGHO2_12_FULL_63_10]